MSEEIQKSWSFYQTLFLSGRKNDLDLQRQASVFLHNIDEFDSKYTEEMKGIAAGSSVELWKIGAHGCHWEGGREGGGGGG
jgi:hypothetical protein